MSRLLTWACALLLGVSAVGWARSYWARDLVYWSNSAGVYVELTTIPGVFRLALVQGWIKDQPLHWYRQPPPAWLPVFGQQAMDSGGPSRADGRRAVWLPTSPAGGVRLVTPYRVLQIPFASLTALALLVLLVQLALAARRHLAAAANMPCGLVASMSASEARRSSTFFNNAVLCSSWLARIDTI